MNDWLIHCQNTTAGTVLSKIINFNNNVKGPQTVFFFFYVKSQFLLKKFYWILDLQVKMRVWQEPILSIWIGHGKSRFVIPEASLVWWRGGDREAMMVQNVMASYMTKSILLTCTTATWPLLLPFHQVPGRTYDPWNSFAHQYLDGMQSPPNVLHTTALQQTLCLSYLVCKLFVNIKHESIKSNW